MTAINTNVDLRSKKFSGASISPVWQYFGFKQDETDSDPPTCKLCLKKVCAAGGNTSNLRRHLQNNHPVESSKIAKAKPEKRQADTAGAGQSTSQNQQLSIADAFSKLQKYERGGKQWQKLTDSVTKCLAKDMMPIYTVEKSGFQQLLKDFDPKYQLPSRKYFSNQATPKLYNETKESILQHLRSAQFFSATSDMWSSNTMEPYMSYTVHYIDPDWKLQSRCLQTL
jgi:tRNA (cytidine32/guanosine34-2'-O)-methyltransferase